MKKFEPQDSLDQFRKKYSSEITKDFSISKENVELLTECIWNSLPTPEEFKKLKQERHAHV